jgi:hypothetical protein
LIIVDTLARFGAQDTELDNAAATRFIQLMERLAAVPGRPTVEVAHHINKNARRDTALEAGDPAAAAASRGASALTDSPRFAALLEPLKRVDGAPELKIMRIVKSNYGQAIPDTYFVLDAGNHGAPRCATEDEYGQYRAAVEGQKVEKAQAARTANHDALRDAVFKVLRKAKEPLSVHEIRDRAGGALTTISKLLKNATDEGGPVAQVFDGKKSQGWVWRAESRREAN